MHIKTAALFAVPFVLICMACNSPKKQTVTVLQQYIGAVEGLNKQTTPAYQKIQWERLNSTIDPRMQKDHQNLISPDELRQVFRQLESQVSDDKAFPVQAQAQLQAIFRKVHPFTMEAVGLSTRMDSGDPRNSDMLAIATYRTQFEKLTSKAYDDIDALVKKGSSFK